jgi:predicted molibdopterin-dependent oxidoreductase YjgC
MSSQKKENKMTIDGIEIAFTPGETILSVAKRAGIYIPNLCYIENLIPYGGCRLCTVKVEGDRKPYQTACSTEAIPGMKIITKDEELQTMRKEIIQLILSEHPNNCLVCGHSKVCDDFSSHPDQRNADRVFGCFACASKEICQLREVFDYLEIKDLVYDLTYKNLKPEPNSLFFDRDYNLCILCGKCVRACGELRGYNALSIVKRGNLARVVTGSQPINADSGCQFCGTCMDVCPVGVYTTKKSKWVRRKDQFIASKCGFCSMNCGMQYFTENGRLIEAVPDKTHPLTKGLGCVLGHFCVPEFHYSSKRLITPLVKGPSGLNSTDWGSAFTAIQTKLAKYAPNQIAVLVSPDISNETAYLFKEFAGKILKTPHIGMMAHGISMKSAHLLQAIPRKLDMLPGVDWILLVNANVQFSQPALFTWLKKAWDTGVKIIALHTPKEVLSQETKNILTEELIQTPEEILKTILSYDTGKGCIILGTPGCDEFNQAAINVHLKNSSIIVLPLYPRANMEGVWNFIQATEDNIFQDIVSGKIKAIVTTERLPSDLQSKLEVVILQDIFESDCSLKADVVLPAATFLESDGTFLNLQLESQNFTQVIRPPNLAMPDWKILGEWVASQFPGFKKDFVKKSAAEITALLPSVTKPDLGKLNPFKIGKMGQTHGLWADLAGFTYRGEVIANHVPDLARLIAHRKKDLPAEPLKKAADVYDDSALNLIITPDAAVKIGAEKYGLEVIQTAATAAQHSGQKLNVILDSYHPHLGYYPSEEFCLCNNYRNNLVESGVMVDLSRNSTIKNFLKTTGAGGSEYLPISGVVLLKQEFVEMPREDLNAMVFSNNDKKNSGMQMHAFHNGWTMAQKKTIQIRTSGKEIVEDDIMVQAAPHDIWTVQSQRDPDAKSRDVGPKYVHFAYPEVVHVDVHKCMGCGTCSDVCPHQAIRMVAITESRGLFKNQIVRHSEIDPNICYKCAYCVNACPIQAIHIKTWSESRS